MEKHETSLLDEIKRFLGFDIPPHTIIELKQTWVGTVKSGLQDIDDVGISSDAHRKLQRKGYEVQETDRYGGPDLDKKEMDELVDVEISHAVELISKDKMLEAQMKLRPLIKAVESGTFRVGEYPNIREAEIDDEFRESIIRRVKRLHEYFDDSPLYDSDVQRLRVQKNRLEDLDNETGDSQ